jgi:hypothetical protein
MVQAEGPYPRRLKKILQNHWLVKNFEAPEKPRRQYNLTRESSIAKDAQTAEDCLCLHPHNILRARPDRSPLSGKYLLFGPGLSLAHSRPGDRRPAGRGRGFRRVRLGDPRNPVNLHAWPARAASPCRWRGGGVGAISPGGARWQGQARFRQGDTVYGVRIPRKAGKGQVDARSLRI